MQIAEKHISLDYNIVINESGINKQEFRDTINMNYKCDIPSTLFDVPSGCWKNNTIDHIFIIQENRGR